MITSTWRSEMSRYLLANDVLDLELNYAKGWRGNELSFLKELLQLRAFKIIDHFGLPDAEPIHYLHELRALAVQTRQKNSSRVRFRIVATTPIAARISALPITARF